MATGLTKHLDRTIARPLKVLIPMIQSELQQGNEAGHDHYLRAGQMLIEAKDQVGYGNWGRWLAKNFELSQHTANVYMRWAREHDKAVSGDGASKVPYRSMREMTGAAEHQREERRSTQHQAFKRTLRDVARDTFLQERQTREQEIANHRKMAERIIVLGYRALATQIHPDRGGSKEEMSMATRIRDDLLSYAKSRRFI